MIIRNLFRRTTRTLLTIFGISIGVAAIISLGVMADGLKAGYSSMLSGSQADLALSQPNAIDISYSSIDEKIGDQLLAMPEVKDISGMLQGIVQTDSSPYFFVFGYPEESFILERFNIVEGVGLYDRKATSQKGKPVILGMTASETMNKEVGDTIRITGVVYRIVGIYQTGDGFEDSGAVVPMDEAQNLLGKPRQVSLYYIKLKENANLETLETRVNRLWPDLSISSTAELNDKQILGDSLEGFVWVIAGLAIILGGVGMTNAMLMSIMERTREIGVLRAVGWSRMRVMRMILTESLIVSLAGGVFGSVLGWAIIALIGSSTVLFGVSGSSISSGLFVQAFVVVFLLGLIGGAYPAWKAAQLKPIEAIRYEGGSAGKHVRRLPVGGMALQSLWQRTSRTLLTLFVIALTVGSIMAMESVILGTSDDFTNMAVGSDVEIMVRQADVSDTSLSAIDERLGDKIAAMPEVAHVSGMAMTAIMLPDNEGFFIIMGYAPNEYAIRRFNIIEGEKLSSNHRIIIGKVMAESMNKGVGDTINLGGSRYKISGIYESGVSWEEMGGVLTLRDAQNFMGRPRKVTMYAVKVHDPSDAPKVVKEINSKYPELHAALSGEFVEQLPDMEASDAMMSAISIMAILVGGVGVMNTMLMAVYERTREIGVLRALGWRRRAVLRMIVKESLLLSLIGGCLGIIFAFILVQLFRLAPMVSGMLSPEWNFGVFARAFIIAVALGLAGGLYPAYRATRLAPVEALRYE